MANVQKVNFRAAGSNLLQSGAATTVIQNSSNPSAPNSASNPAEDSKKEVKKLKTAAYVSSAVALASLGVGVAVIARQGRFLNKVASELTQQRRLLGESLEQAVGTKIEKAFTDKLEPLETKIEEVAKKAKQDTVDLGKWHDGMIEAVEKRVNKIEVLNKPIILERNLAVVDNFKLLQNLKNNGERKRLPENLIKKLNNTADIYINNGVVHPKIKKLDKDSTVWSITAEALPEKEGGLGEVPSQIAKNLSKEFEINNYELLPLYEIAGKSQIVKEGRSYKYYYNLQNPEPYSLELNKVVEFQTQAFRNEKYENQLVEVFIGQDAKGVQKMYFKNSDYFKSTGLYDNSQKASEPERFAFFSKAVYDFIKLKADSKSTTAYNIFNADSFKAIKVPDAMILNDWHAGGLASLLRYKAPIEGHFGELNQTVANDLSSMNLVNIVHNADYQGISWEHGSEMLNTLFDKYALDIYENAHSGFGHNGLGNVLKIDNNVNLANMAACLSNKVKPVSPTYGRELAEQNERSKGMQHVFATRLKQGTLKGASNGWDRVDNEVKRANDGNLNKDKILIVKEALLNISGITNPDKNAVNEIINNNFNVNHFKDKIINLRKLEIPEVTEVLDKLDEKGLTKLRETAVYTSKNTIDEIMDARKQNKLLLLDHLKSMLEYNKTHEKKLFNIVELENTSLDNINLEGLEEVPFFNMVARFVSQKGIDVTAESVKKILANWDVKYPGKKKPVFVIGGADGEGGNIKAIATAMKQKLGKDGEQIVYMDGFAPSDIFQSGTDFTIYSSWFEPDGSKWESLNKGTPAICTKVGGHVDSIIDGVNGFLTNRTIPEIINSKQSPLEALSNDMVDAIHRSLDTFYNKNTYMSMVRNTIAGDQSWLIKNSKGNITGGALLGHMTDLGFDLSEFSKIELPV